MTETEHPALKKMETRVTVEAHNPLWKFEFHKLSKIYHDRLVGLILAVEHVGSTAIANLCAKPILDIDIVIEDAGLLPDIIVQLGGMGYFHEGNLGIPGREAFQLQDPVLLTGGKAEKVMDHHLYVCVAGSEELRRHIAFRETLQKNPEAAAAYGTLKKGLALTAENRAAYTEGKSLFIQSLMERKWIDSENK